MRILLPYCQPLRLTFARNRCNCGRATTGWWPAATGLYVARPPLVVRCVGARSARPPMQTAACNFSGARSALLQAANMKRSLYNGIRLCVGIPTRGNLRGMHEWAGKPPRLVRGIRFLQRESPIDPYLLSRGRERRRHKLFQGIWRKKIQGKTQFVLGGSFLHTFLADQEKYGPRRGFPGLHFK